MKAQPETKRNCGGFPIEAGRGHSHFPVTMGPPRSGLVGVSGCYGQRLDQLGLSNTHEVISNVCLGSSMDDAFCAMSFATAKFEPSDDCTVGDGGFFLVSNAL